MSHNTSPQIEEISELTIIPLDLKIKNALERLLDTPKISTDNTNLKSKVVITRPADPSISTYTPNNSIYNALQDVSEKPVDLENVMDLTELYYQNVAESVLRDQAPDFMEKLCSCQCERCLLDVIALSLSVLPSHYICSNEDVPEFKKSAYAIKYRHELTTAITRACMKVNINPRH